MIARTTETELPRVILAEDHEMVRDGIRVALDSRMEIVAEVANGLDAVAAANVLQPDLILMDLSLPGMTGIDATRRIAAQQPQVKVLCVSMYSDTVFVRAALEAGASGYVLKESPISELVQAIEEVRQGRRYVDPRVAAPPTIEGGHDPSSPFDRPEDLLTSQEIEVLRLIAARFSDKEIAFRLQLAPERIGAIREQIMDRLDLHDVGGLRKYAIEFGLIGSDTSLE